MPAAFAQARAMVLALGAICMALVVAQGSTNGLSLELRDQISAAILKGVEAAGAHESLRDRLHKAIKFRVMAVLGASQAPVATMEVGAGGEAAFSTLDANGGQMLAPETGDSAPGQATDKHSSPTPAWDTVATMFGWMSKASVVIGIAIPLTILASTIGFAPTSAVTGISVYAFAVWLVGTEVGLPWGGGDRLAAIETALTRPAGSGSLLEQAGLMLFGGAFMCMLAMQAFLVPSHIATHVGGSTRRVLMMIVAVAGPSPRFWGAHILLLLMSGAGVAMIPGSWMLWLLVWMSIGHLVVDAFAHALALAAVLTACSRKDEARGPTRFSALSALIILTSTVAVTFQLLLVLLVAKVSSLLAEAAPAGPAAPLVRFRSSFPAEPLVSAVLHQLFGRSLAEIVAAAPALAAALQPAAMAGVVAAVWAIAALAVSVASSLKDRPGAMRLAAAILTTATGILFGALVVDDPATVEVMAVVLAITALPAAVQVVAGLEGTGFLDSALAVLGGFVLALRSPAPWAAFVAAGGSLSNPQALLSPGVLQQLASLSIVGGSAPLLGTAALLIAVAVAATARSSSVWHASPLSRFAAGPGGVFVPAATLSALFGGVTLLLGCLGTLAALFPVTVLTLVSACGSALLWLPIAFLSPVEWIVGLLAGKVSAGLLLLVAAGLALFARLTLNPRASAVAMEATLLPATIAVLLLLPSPASSVAPGSPPPLPASLPAIAPHACEWLAQATGGIHRHATVALILTVLHRIFLRRSAGLCLREKTLPGQILAAAARSILVVTSLAVVHALPDLHDAFTALLGPVAPGMVSMSLVAVLGDLVASLVRAYTLFSELHTRLPERHTGAAGVVAADDDVAVAELIAKASAEADLAAGAEEDDDVGEDGEGGSTAASRREHSGDDDDVNVVMRELLGRASAPSPDFATTAGHRDSRLVELLVPMGLPLPGTEAEALALLPMGSVTWVSAFVLHAAATLGLAFAAGVLGNTWVTLGAVATAPQALLLLGVVDGAITNLPALVRVLLLCTRAVISALGIFLAAKYGSDQAQPSVILASAVAAAFCTASGELAVHGATFHELPGLAAPIVGAISSASLLLVRLALQPGAFAFESQPDALPMAVVIAATALATAMTTTLQLAFRGSAAGGRAAAKGVFGGEPAGLAATGSGAIHSSLLAVGLALPMLVDPAFGWVLGDGGEAFSTAWVIQACVVGACVWLATSAPVVADTTGRPTTALLLVGLVQVAAVLFATTKDAALLPLFAKAATSPASWSQWLAGEGSAPVPLPDLRLVLLGGPEAAAAVSRGLSLDARWALALCRCGLAILLSVPLYKPTPRLVRVAIAALLLCDPIAASFGSVLPVFIAWQLFRPHDLERHVTDVIGTWAAVTVIPLLATPGLLPGVPSLDPAVGVPSLLLFAALTGASEQVKVEARYQPWATLAASLAMLAHIQAATFWWPAAHGAAQIGVTAAWIGAVALALGPPLISAAVGHSWRLLLVVLVGGLAVYIGAHDSHSPLLAAAGAATLFAGFVIGVARASRGSFVVVLPVASIALGVVLSLLSQAAQAPDPLLAASKQMGALLERALAIVR